MGLSRDSRHKRRATGGRRNVHVKKRKYELARPSAMTKLGPKKVRAVRVRGGNKKYRALQLDHGNFAWTAEACTRPVRILGTVYNATSNELTRTSTLVKGAVVHVDATEFRKYYQQRFGEWLGKGEAPQEFAVSERGQRRRASRAKKAQGNLSEALRAQFEQGRLLAIITSRPGQCGRADGRLLEGEELAFYQRKVNQRRK